MSAFLEDGFATKYTFGTQTTSLMKEKTLTPAGMEGGGAIDQSTMHNTAYRTAKPKTLKNMTPSNATVSYDPGVYADIINMINVNQLITITFPDDSTVAFYGWLDSFVPNEHVEGEQPTAEITIIPSLLDGTNTETAPVYTAAA